MAEAVGYLIIAGLEAVGAVGAGAATAATTTTIFTGLTVAGAVGTAAILGVSIAVAYATQPQVPSAGDGSQPIRQAIPPRPFGYGRTRITGAYMLFEVDPTTQHSWDVLAVHQGRIEQIVHLYLNDDIVGVNGSGFVDRIINVDEPGTSKRYSHGDANRVVIKTTTGLDTETAFADVVADLPTLWTSAHRGDGVASLMLKCQDVQPENIPKVYPRGLPKPSIAADLSPVWDPRDGGQSRDNPATWKVSSNPVLQLLDYLTHDRGPALDYATLIEPHIDDWMAEADICDEAVAKADGSTQPRYRSDGWAYLTTEPAEVISAILGTCDGWMAEAGDGTLVLRVGKYRAPAVTLTDDHIVGLDIQFGVADEEIVNEVQFSYTAPQANWRDCPGIAMRDEASIAELGVVRSERLALPWVQSHSQGRRLAKRRLARHQAVARGTLATGLYGLKALGQRWVGVRSREIADLANAVIEISKVRIDLAKARLAFDFVLVNPNSIDAWDPATEEGVAPNYFPVPVDVTAADAGAGNQINVDFDALDPELSWLYYVVDYRVGSSGPWTRELFFADSDLTGIGGGRVRLQTSAVSPGTYSVRVAATGPQVVEPTEYTVKTAVLVATTANITLSGEQLIDGISVITDNRVLVWAQTNPAENGIWVVSAGAWVRAIDMDTWAEVVDAAVPVTLGTTWAGRTFYSTVPDSGTVGVTGITFATSREAVILDPDLVWAPDVAGATVVIA